MRHLLCCASFLVALRHLLQILHHQMCEEMMAMILLDLIWWTAKSLCRELILWQMAEQHH